MSSKTRTRKKEVSHTEAVKSVSNSLDWDSPSTKTGTVKRRPVSSDSFVEFRANDCWDKPGEKNEYRDSTIRENPRHESVRRKNDDCRDNTIRENYSRDNAFCDKWNKCEPEKRPNRSVSVYDPPTPIRGVSSNIGQVTAVKGQSLSGDAESAPRHIKVLSLDASQARIRHIQNFVQNKYVVYRKDKEDWTNTYIPHYNRDSSTRSAMDKATRTRQVQFNQNKIEDQTAKDNNYLSTLNCYAHYPVDVLVDPESFKGEGKCTKDRRRMTLNGDFPRENVYLIETNCLPTRITYGSFKVGSNEGRCSMRAGEKLGGREGDRRSLQEYNSSKTGKVSDTDSGIASPLSPGSVYGFLGYTDKDNGFKKHPLEIRGKVERVQQDCCCIEERSQVNEKSRCQ